MQKLRIGVLFGGASNEREISLESGRNVCYKLSPEKYDVTPLFMRHDLTIHEIGNRLLVRNTTKEIAEALPEAAQLRWSDLPQRFDFIFIALHGGVGENGSVQGALETLGMPYNGSSVLQSALCLNKFKTNEFLHANGFDIPKHACMTVETWNSDNSKACPFAFPVIVKPHDDGCSVMVQKAHNQAEFETAVETIFAHQKQVALIEEFMTGMEITIGVIGNERAYALPPSQSLAAKSILSMEEKFLPGAGENQTPALLPAEAIAFIRATAEKMYTCIGCTGYARIDCFYQDAQMSPTGKERLVALEFNTVPALTPATCLFHQAAEVDISPSELIDLIVQLGLERHTNKPCLTEKQRQLWARQPVA